MPVRVHPGSVLEVAAEALVNAANTQMVHGGGVAAAIARAAGGAMEEESRRLAPVPLAGAVATGPGRLALRGVRHIIHVPTVDYLAGRRAKPRDVTEGTLHALDLARSLGCPTVAFPLLGAGVVGLAPEAAARAMASAMAGAGDLDVVVCAYSAADRRAVAAVWPAAAAAVGLGPPPAERHRASPPRR